MVESAKIVVVGSASRDVFFKVGKLPLLKLQTGCPKLGRLWTRQALRGHTEER